MRTRAQMKVLPCPCCGNKKLWVGATSGAEYGVQCLRRGDLIGLGKGCGLQIARPLPSETRRPVSIDELEFKMLNQAVKAWNRRK